MLQRPVLGPPHFHIHTICIILPMLCRRWNRCNSTTVRPQSHAENELLDRKGDEFRLSTY